MLLALAALVIGGTILFTGPAQAVILQFHLVEDNTTTVDSLLCPNRTYTFSCEVDNVQLRLTSFDSTGSAIATFLATPGSVGSQGEFDFAAVSTMNGIRATAVVDSSISLSSARLECTDTIDSDSRSLSTNVKHPLDATTDLKNTCRNDTTNGVIVFELKWAPVDCAEVYTLNISGLGLFNTTTTALDINVTASTTTNESTYSITVIFYAAGGRVTEFGFSCQFIPVNVCEADINGCADVAQDDDCGYFTAVANIKIGGDTSIMTVYTLTFINFPARGRAYYETTDGRVEDITVTDGVGDVSTDSGNVTVTVTYENGTVDYTQQVQEPSISGEGIFIVFWILVVILILGVLLGVGGTVTVIVIVKFKTSNQVKQHATSVLQPQHQEHKMAEGVL